MAERDSAPKASRPVSGPEKTPETMSAPAVSAAGTPTALRGLVDQGVLTESQLDAVVTALSEDRTPPTPVKLLSEIAAYAGAGLLLSGFVLLLAASWEDMARLGRVALFALVALGLAVTGIALVGGPKALFGAARRRVRETGHTIRTRLAMVLFALAAVGVAAAVGSGIEDGNADIAWVYACLAGLAVGVLGYAAFPSLVGMLVCAGFAVAVLSGVLNDLWGVDEELTGIGFLALGLGWLGVARLGVILERWAGYAVGILVALWGAQVTSAFVEYAMAYLLTGLLAVLCFALYLTDRSPVLVLGGTIALSVAAAEAVWHWTDGSISAAGAVLVAGAVVLGLGSALLTRRIKPN
ncbi:DUF2157 domain-containing protein [Nocardia paucivorans]|uniref:DUF2157 domain-containing protein n=1 Tax=Nocardia paucivorans TaxID=114259 RepID=UPI00059331DC|nr:DUF2157 domain-containing protein [Nocardia paucivorans]